MAPTPWRGAELQQMLLTTCTYGTLNTALSLPAVVLTLTGSELSAHPGFIHASTLRGGFVFLPVLQKRQGVPEMSRKVMGLGARGSVVKLSAQVPCHVETQEHGLAWGQGCAQDLGEPRVVCSWETRVYAVFVAFVVERTLGKI